MNTRRDAEEFERKARDTREARVARHQRDERGAHVELIIDRILIELVADQVLDLELHVVSRGGEEDEPEGLTVEKARRFARLVGLSIFIRHHLHADLAPIGLLAKGR